jgi:uncharacterized membrane protein YphA (DoxX/SURF4 family)
MAAKVGRLVWAGRVLTVLVSLLFLMSGVMKFIGGDALKKEMERMQIPVELIQPIGTLELICVLIYAIPATSMVGAILLTGYLGGAILTHLRVNDPYIVQAILGVVVWLALWLREGRLRSLMPIRF